MSEEKKKTTKKVRATKKVAPKKASPKKVTASATVKKKSTVKVKKQASNVVTITQVGSPIGRKPYQRATLIGLGLNKMHKTSVLEDTEAVRGMINKVKHLIRIEDAA